MVNKSRKHFGESPPTPQQSIHFVAAAPGDLPGSENANEIPIPGTRTRFFRHDIRMTEGRKDGQIISLEIIRISHLEVKEFRPL